MNNEGENLEDKYIDIVFCFDLRMLAPASVTVASLLDSNNDKNVHYNIYCVSTDDINVIEKTLGSVIKKRDEKSNLKLISANKFFNESFEIRDISVATYLRLLLPELLPNDINQIIYSDVDILFLNSINELNTLEMSDNCYAGVPALWVILNQPEEISSYFDEETMKKYINAGFIVLNLKELRKSYNREFIIEESKKKYYFQDQDIINYNYKDRIKTIPVRFNVNATEDNFLSAIEKNIITKEDYNDYLEKGRQLKHYTGQKPWNNANVDNADLWINYVQKNRDLRKICKNLPVFKPREVFKRFLKNIFAIRNNCCDGKKYKVVILFGKVIFRKEKV